MRCFMPRDRFKSAPRSAPGFSTASLIDREAFSCIWSSYLEACDALRASMYRDRSFCRQPRCRNSLSNLSACRESLFIRSDMRRREKIFFPWPDCFALEIPIVFRISFASRYLMFAALQAPAVTTRLILPSCCREYGSCGARN